MDKIYHRLDFRQRTFPKFFLQTYFSKFYLKNGGDIPESDLSEVLEEFVNEAITKTKGDMDAKTFHDRTKISFIINGYGLGNNFESLFNY